MSRSGALESPQTALSEAFALWERPPLAHPAACAHPQGGRAAPCSGGTLAELLCGAGRVGGTVGGPLAGHAPKVPGKNAFSYPSREVLAQKYRLNFLSVRQMGGDTVGFILHQWKGK